MVLINEIESMNEIIKNTDIYQDSKLFENVMDFAPIAIILFSPDGKIVFANKKSSEVLGINSDELQSM